MSSSQTEYYKKRTGTSDEGKNYEIRMLALLSLRCVRQNKDDNFWFASNIDGVGNFDDVILCVGEDSFLLQLKHKKKPDLIKMREYLIWKKNETDFYLKKYIKDICTVQSRKATCKPSNTRKDIITKLSSFDNIHFLLYTNRPTNLCDFLEQHTCSGYLSNLNSKRGLVYSINVTSASSKVGLNNVSDIKKFYLFCNQINQTDLRNEIIEELRKITKSYDTVYDGYIKFITEWREDNLDEQYLLKRIDIVSKLTQLVLDDFEIKLSRKPYNVYNDEKKLIWNKIIQDKTITVIDINDDNISICNFLLQYIGNEVGKFCNTVRKKFWSDAISQADLKLFYKHNHNFESELLKIKGRAKEVLLCDVYKCLWNLQKLPLLLNIKTKEEHVRVCEMLKLSNYAHKIIILNRSGERLAVNKKVNHFENLQDLEFTHQEEIITQPITFQGRSGARLKDIVDKAMFTEIKVADIINILLNDFNIGNKLNFVPEYYRFRLFSNLLPYDILKGVTDDIFFVEDREELIKDFAAKENLKILHLSSNNLQDVNDYRIIVSSSSEELKNLKFYGQNVHNLVVHNSSYLLWKESIGKIHNIESFQLEYLPTVEYNCLSSLTTVISAGPGMGKSMLMDSIAQKAPTNKWVLRINLRKETDYYQALNKEANSTGHHLNQFRGSLNGELETQIFNKFLKNKDILILLDGFDELSISHKKKVTNLAKSFHDDGFCLCLSTRPTEKSHLEKEFHVSALELLPFNKTEQRLFLKKFLIFLSKDDAISVNVKEEEADEFVEKLLQLLMNSLKNKQDDFTATPLHIRMLAETYCKNYDRIDVNKQLDLLVLYKMFIEEKNEILYDKFGATHFYDLYKNYQCLFALKLLFQYLNFDRYIDEYIQEKYRKMTDEQIKLLAIGGILTVDKNLKVDFVHQTFAEYLAAKWLSKNLYNESAIVKYILERIYEFFTAINYDFFRTHYPVFQEVFDSRLIENSNDSFKKMYFYIISGQTDKIREMIKENSIDLCATDYAKRSLLHLLVIYNLHYPNLEDVTLELVEKSTNIEADAFGYNPIDYALRYALYDLANAMCKKWTRSKVREPVNNCSLLFTLLLVGILKYPYLIKAVVVYNAYYDVMLNGVKKEEELVKCVSIRRADYAWVDTTLFHRSMRICQLPGFEMYTMDNLCYEIVCGSTSEVEKLLQTNNDANMEDVTGLRPLHYAAFHGKVEIIDVLLSHNADANIKCRHGDIPLNYSIVRGEFEAFRKLVDKTNIKNVSDLDNKTPLHYAVMFKRLQMIDLLLSKGSDVYIYKKHSKTTSLHSLIRRDSRELSVALRFDSFAKLAPITEDEICEMVDLFVSRGVDVNIQNFYGDTLLHCSADRGKGKIVSKLLSHSANVKITNPRGHTPLHNAILRYIGEDPQKERYLEIITLLVLNGTDLKGEDFNGEFKLLQELILHGPDLKVRQFKRGNTPLHLAITQYKGLDIIKFLLLAGVDVNRKNYRGWTPLHYAVMNGNYNASEALISSKAHINLQDENGNTPLHLAVSKRKKSDIIDLLLSNGADANITNFDKETPLHVSVKNHAYKATEILLRRDVSVNAQDTAGNTPLDYLAVSGRKPDTRLRDLLLSYGA